MRWPMQAATVTFGSDGAGRPMTPDNSPLALPDGRSLLDRPADLSPGEFLEVIQVLLSLMKTRRSDGGGLCIWSSRVMNRMVLPFLFGEGVSCLVAFMPSGTE